jgi:hypothetical protein
MEAGNIKGDAGTNGTNDCNANRKQESNRHASGATKDAKLPLKE